MRDTVTVENYILCPTYSEALTVSKAFERFVFHVSFLGKHRKIRAKRFIRKGGNSSHPYRVIIRYVIPCDGTFEEYGYLDQRTLSKYPDMPKQLLDIPDYDRPLFVLEHSSYKKDGMIDFVFYRDFKHFLSRSLSKLLGKLYLASVIAFGNQYPSDCFAIYYKEKGQFWERLFFAPHSLTTCISKEILPLHTKKVLSISRVWSWMNQAHYRKKDKGFSEVRALTALSYVINREPFECLLYATIGLESIFTKDEKCVKQQLKNTIPKLFPEITEEDINQLYRKRSDFVHGDIFFPTNEQYRTESMDGVFEYHKIARLASTLLLVSIRTLVETDSTQIFSDANGIIIYRKNLPSWLNN